MTTSTVGRPALARDAVPLLILAVLGLGALFRLRHDAVSAPDVVFSIILWVPALFRRSFPRAAFGSTAVLVALHWVPSGLDALRLLPADLALLLCLAAVTERCRTGWAVAATATVEVFALATLIGSTAPPEGHPVAPLSAFTLVAALLGRNLRARAVVVAGLRERADRAERDQDQLARIAVAEERTRIAREVHDIVSHNVSVMTALADGAGSALRSAGGPGQAADAVAAIATTGREALVELHGMLGVLRSADHQVEDAERRPVPGLGDLAALVEQVRGAGLPITLSIVGRAAPLNSADQLTVYRVVQEALTNVRRHGRGVGRVRVELRWADERLDVVIADDGRSTGAARRRAGHGLVGMRERVAASGGSVTAGPAHDDGWVVTASLPLSVPPGPP